MMRDNTSQTNQQQIFEILLIKALSIATRLVLPFKYTVKLETEAEIRSQHAHLNQLILSRLPLALPPHSHSPLPYAQGLLHFAAIYYAFESAWQILSDYEPVSELPLETAVVLSSLIHLHIPALARVERLITDLSLLLSLPQSEVTRRIQHPSSKQTIAFVAHIRDTARNKPHALIAYAWVMYMALFNGGRWIREQLCTARDISWVPTNAELASSETAGLGFWFFEGSDDGDDIKEDFKTRLVDVGSMLGPEHREDIIDEAKTIFERCAGMVEELDTFEKDAAVKRGQEMETARWSRLHELLSFLLPMVVMQLLMLMVQRISGTRVRSPLPFRKFDRKDD